MTPRTTLILSAVLGIAGVGLLEYQNRGDSVTVYQVASPMKAGVALQTAARPVAVPRSTYTNMASTVPNGEFEQFVRTAPLTRDVQAGELVQFDMLLRSAAEGLKIADGMRAVAVDINRSSQAVGYLLRPGDRVDVIATVTEADGPSAKTILQDRAVLAAGQQYRVEDSAFLQSRTYGSVTLEVAPPEAEMLERYRPSSRDGFTLVLRPRRVPQPAAAAAK